MASSSDREMTSSEPSATSPLTPPSLEELSRRGVRTLLLPWIITLAASSPSEAPREVVVLVNLRTGSITMIDGANDIEALMRSKDGPLPASKASIEAMPAVEVKEEGLECAICLTEFEINGEAKEMPCKHKYHAGCIVKWLGIHGSCPVCRYRMPAEEEVENTKGGGNEEANGGGGGGDGGDGDGEGNGSEERRDGAGFVFHIFLAGSRRRDSDSDLDLGSDSDTGRNENETNGGNPDSGSDNDGSAAQDMDIDR